MDVPISAWRAPVTRGLAAGIESLDLVLSYAKAIAPVGHRCREEGAGPKPREEVMYGAENSCGAGTAVSGAGPLRLYAGPRRAAGARGSGGTGRADGTHGSGRSAGTCRRRR